MKILFLSILQFIFINIVNASDNIYWYLGGISAQGIIYDHKINEDNNEIVIISDIERKIKIVDLNTNNLKNIISPAYPVNELATFSPDGNYLLKTNIDRINIFNFNTNEFLCTINNYDIRYRCSDNSKFIIFQYNKINNDTLYIYRIQNCDYLGKYISEIDAIDSNANIFQVDSLGRLTEVNLITKKTKLDTIVYPEKIPNSGNIAFIGKCYLSFSENLLLINNYGLGNIKVFNIKNNKIIGDITYLPTGFIYFSADETNLIFCAPDTRYPSFSINIASGITVQKYDDMTKITSSTYPLGIEGKSSKGNYLYLQDWDIQIYEYYNLNTHEQHPIFGCAGEILKTAFSNDNNILFAYEKRAGVTTDRRENLTRIQAFDLEKKKRVWVSNEIFKFEKWGTYLNYYPFALSSNDKYIAVASTDSSYTSFPIIVIETFTNPSYPYIPDSLTFKGHVYPVTSLAISDDEKYLASGDIKGNIKIWDIEKHSLIKNILTKEDTIFSIKFINNDEIEFTCKDGNQMWSISKGVQIINFTNPLNLGLSKNEWKYYPNFPLVYSNSGAYCAFNNHNNGINIYNTSTNDTLGNFDSGEVLALTFSDDNKYLATSYKNENYIKIWDFQNKKEVARNDYNPYAKVFHHLSQDSMWAPLEALSFSHDGKYIAGGNYDGSVIIWENTINGVNYKNDMNKSGFEIYPNPASSSVKLKYESSGYSKLQISIFDLLGNEVFNTSEDCNIGMNEKTIDCSSLETGYYIIRLKQGERVEAKPFLLIKN